MGFLLSNYQLTICILCSLIFRLSSSAHLCHNEERTALLQFKQSVSFNCNACDCGIITPPTDNSSPLTDNWKEGTDCCAWDGITCDNTTSHVIGLDLYCMCLYATIHPNSSLFNLVHLQKLDLSRNNFNHSQILPSFGRFTNLTHLHLNYSYFSGPIQSSEEEVWQGNNFSNSIFHLQKLQELSLAGNTELTGKLPSFINGTLRHLRSLDLSSTGFTGELPNSIGQLEFLEELFLNDCNFFGTIPTSLGNLKKLRMLELGGNKLINGTIPILLTNLTQLISLDLSYNKFEGPIPQHFSNLSQLRRIDFSNNQLTGPIPSSITGLPNLHTLNLGSNSISGTIPPSLFHLVNLTILDLSSNKLSDTVELDTFAKLEYLEYLCLSNSGLSLTTTNSSPSSFRNIGTLQLSSCKMNKIPEFLKTQNQMLAVLDLSNNHLNEELNPLCNLHFLQYLKLSNNQFGGLIPTCLGNFSGLVGLNLQGNNFSGTIPQTFGYASILKELDISHNGLQGVLPRSLVNCTNLEILNVGHNFIEDAFPFWLENLDYLKIIVLRDNKFHGPIEQPRKGLVFSNLHIIDMSHNEFTGTLPSKYFESMYSMMMDDEDKSSLHYMGNGYVYYSVTIMNKGLAMEFVRIITILKAVDFSHNKFDGNIPISIGRLKALCVLNFSKNSFTGPIPLSLVSLTELESLDLSQNKLSGEIPQQLKNLTFLEVFNVSQNNLTGMIPRGKQFETFSNTSYGGNAGLCGFPLSKKCKTPKVAESPSLPSSSSHNYKSRLDGFGWEAVLMGYGCGAIFGLVIGSCIIQRKEEWLARIFRVKMHHQKNKSNKVKYQHGTR
ncbi:unnamed protein product [Camellia sinensis]